MSKEFANQFLTPTERRVLSLIGKGSTSKDIAHALKMSVLTVGNHRKSICRKLGVHSTAELVARASAALGDRQPPPLGTPCTLVLVWREGQQAMQVTYRGHLRLAGGSATVAIGDVTFSF